LVYWEEHKNRVEAAIRERKIKNRNRSYKKQLIAKFRSTI